MSGPRVARSSLRGPNNVKRSEAVSGLGYLDSVLENGRSIGPSEAGVFSHLPFRNVTQVSSLKVWYLGVVCRKTNWEENIWAFVRRPVQNLRQKPHRRRCVGQRRKSHPVNRSDEQSARDPDALLHVIVFRRLPFASTPKVPCRRTPHDHASHPDRTVRNQGASAYTTCNSSALEKDGDLPR